jgi:hypothetical protein
MDWGKPRSTAVSLVDIQANIRTENFPNTSLKF